LECFEDLRVEEIFEIIPETEPELFRGSKIIRKGEILGEKKLAGKALRRGKNDVGVPADQPVQVVLQPASVSKRDAN
jgi:hypothetical protein